MNLPAESGGWVAVGFKLEPLDLVTGNLWRAFAVVNGEETSETCAGANEAVAVLSARLRVKLGLQVFLFWEP